MAPPTKRQKTGSVADEYICCISLELPVEPVMAEDGYVYERESIEQFFEGNADDEVKSPLSRQVIGKKLLPAPQTRNAIERLIQDGIITGDLAENWTQKKKEKEEEEAKKQLVKRAEEGDIEAMLVLAANYHVGKNSFKQDEKMEFFWYKKAHAAGSIKGTAEMGALLVLGHGVKKDRVQGMVYLARASSESGPAAYNLGMCFAKGLHGLKVDKEEACRLLELALSGKCTQHAMHSSLAKKARSMLAELRTS